MHNGSRIYVAGHRGLVGSSLLRRLQAEAHRHLVTRGRAELNLCDPAAVSRFFATERPAFVFLAAARVGGILANDTEGGDFIRENLLIQTNVIDAAFRHNAKKLLFLGSSCIYPKHAPQPIREDELLNGPLEPTNRPYAVAKIAGIVMAQAYRRQFGFNAISLMPTNLYGPGDNFDPHRSHVLPALMRKFHEAKQAGDPQVVVWGSGTPRREFLHADDLAAAAVFLMHHFDSDEIVNVGAGSDISIRELAELVSEVVGYRGRIVFDGSKPEGTPRKLLDVARLTALGWGPKIPLRVGIEQTYSWFLAKYAGSPQSGSPQPGPARPMIRAAG